MYGQQQAPEARQDHNAAANNGANVGFSAGVGLGGLGGASVGGSIGGGAAGGVGGGESWDNGRIVATGPWVTVPNQSYRPGGLDPYK